MNMLENSEKTKLRIKIFKLIGKEEFEQRMKIVI